MKNRMITGEKGKLVLNMPKWKRWMEVVRDGFSESAETPLRPGAVKECWEVAAGGDGPHGNKRGGRKRGYSPELFWDKKVPSKIFGLSTFPSYSSKCAL